MRHSPHAAIPDRPPPLIPSSGRSVAIDVLRGLAILWVVLFHLWSLSTLGIGFTGARTTYYDRFVDRLREGDALASLTAFTDVLLRLGDDGVAVFMMLSGLSLTAVAVRRGSPVKIAPFYARRLPRLLVPYWAAWLIFIATLAALAAYRTRFDDVEFVRSFQRLGFVRIMDWELALSGLLIVPRALSLERFSAAPPALWFVFLLLQFYLLFPFLLRLLNAVGTLPFLALCLLVSLASTALLIQQAGEVGRHGYLLSMWSPFRIFEFALGMAIGSSFVTAPARLSALLRGAPRMLALLLAAIAAHTLGGTFAADQGYVRAIAQPLIVLGLGGAIVFTCILATRYARAFAAAPLRLLAWAGTISYGVLVVNESFRVVNLYLIMKGWQWSAGWWLYVVVLYVPLTVLLAYPFSVLLRLIPAPQWWPRLRRVQRPDRAAPLLDGPAPDST